MCHWFVFITISAPQTHNLNISAIIQTPLATITIREPLATIRTTQPQFAYFNHNLYTFGYSSPTSVAVFILSENFALFLSQKLFTHTIIITWPQFEYFKSQFVYLQIQFTYLSYSFHTFSPHNLYTSAKVCNLLATIRTPQPQFTCLNHNLHYFNQVEIRKRLATICI